MKNCLLMAVVAVCLSIQFGGEASAQSRVAKKCGKTATKIATSYEKWVDAVCPIYLRAVQIYYGISPSLGQFYSEKFIGVVESTGDVCTDAVLAYADACDPILSGDDQTYFDGVVDEALAAIEEAKSACAETLMIDN